MTGLPEITVIGIVVADPILRYTDNGTPLATLRVAANERRRNRDSGEWEDAATTFLQCVAWGPLAENAAESLSKGHRVILTGALKQRSWHDEQGQTRQGYEVTVTELGACLRFATARLTKTTGYTTGEQISANTESTA